MRSASRARCFDDPDIEICAQTEAEAYRRWLDQLRADYDHKPLTAVHSRS